MMLEIFWLLLSGAIAGLSAGLLGLGGGIIIVPTLVWIFHTHTNIPEIHLMHLAVGTSLMTIVITTLSSISAHQRRGAIQWATARQLIPGLILGAFIGAQVASVLAGELLKTGFGVFVILMAFQLSLDLQPTSRRHLPSPLALNAVGLGIGGFSTLMGIGGGSLTVPFFIGCQVPIRNAVATATVCGFPISLAGALGFIITGWSIKGLPSYSSGYVYWPAVCAITPVSALLAPVGARWAHKLPVNVLKKILAGFLMVIGVTFLLK